MRGACIDIGSNTTRLLAAELDGGRLTPVGEAKVFTRIGASLTSAGEIPEATRRRVVEVVGEQLAQARSLGCGPVIGVATAAVRSAVNGATLLGELRDGTGLRVQEIAPAREAALAFRGAAGMHEGTLPGALGVLDVGGGSSEVVLGPPEGPPRWWRSLAIGSGSLTRACLHHDPPTAAELANADRQVGAVLGDLGDRDGGPPGITLAVGGSATSLCRLAGQRLDPAAFERALGLLCAAPADVVAARHGLEAERVRLLPAGLLVLRGLAARLGDTLECGRGGIREGVLLEALT